jgi:hypothetical protein
MVDLQTAREFVHAHGRDIDVARFDFHFGDGSREAVIEALGHYQNPDGGFGHGLEPDISSPASHAFATELALNAVVDAGISPSHPLVTRAVEYLEAAQSDDGDWPFNPEIYTSPIAPWFEHWTFPGLNPSCTIGGVLTELGLGSIRLRERVARNFARLATTNDLLSNEFYAVRPYAIYLRPEVPRPGRELYLSGVVWWLLRQRATGTLPDASHFLDYVHDPDTYVGRHLPTHVVAEVLDELEHEQSGDGGWPVPYGDHWRPHATVSSLLLLQRFGRIPSAPRRMEVVAQ